VGLVVEPKYSVEIDTVSRWQLRWDGSSDLTVPGRGRFFVLNRNTSKGNNMANEEFARDQYRAGARLAGHPAAGMPSVPKALCGYRMEEQPFQVPSVWRRTPPH